MKAYVFPGQGAQFVGMGKDLYNSSNEAKNYFDKANDILGFGITDIMLGLVSSYYLNVAPGGFTALVSVFVLLLVLTLKRLRVICS